MDFIIVLIGLSTVIIFMYNRSWLFVTKNILLYLGYTLVLFGVSSLFLNFNIGNAKTIPSLKMPLLSLIIFWILNSIFKLLYKRNPQNTFWSFVKMPIQDVVFSMLFLFLGVGLPFFLL